MALVDRYGPAEVNGNAVSCVGCREVVYEDAKAIVNHRFTALPDGRVEWVFGLVVHLCDERFGIVAEAERALYSVE